MNSRAFNTIILPIFFVLKMLLVFYVYFVYSNELRSTFTIEASLMNPDQTAPKGAV